MLSSMTPTIVARGWETLPDYWQSRRKNDYQYGVPNGAQSTGL